MYMYTSLHVCHMYVTCISKQLYNYNLLLLFISGRSRELGISSFGVSVTTMEEVFIKVGQGEDETFQSRYKY